MLVPRLVRSSQRAAFSLLFVSSVLGSFSGCQDNIGVSDRDSMGGDPNEGGEGNDLEPHGGSAGDSSDSSADGGSQGVDSQDSGGQSSGSGGSQSGAGGGKTDSGTCEAKQMLCDGVCIDPEEETCPFCSQGALLCDGECIQPLEDEYYCGATADCQGPDAGQWCSDGSACLGGKCRSWSDVTLLFSLPDRHVTGLPWAMNGSGQAVVAISTEDEGRFTRGWTFESRTWTEPKLIGTGSFIDEVYAIDASGRTILGTGYAKDSTVTYTAHVTAQADHGGSWRALSPIKPENSSLLVYGSALTVDEDHGGAVFSYLLYSDSIWATVYNPFTDTWNQAVEMGPVGPNDLNDPVVYSFEGKGLVAWVGDNGALLSVREFDGSQWTPASQLNPSPTAVSLQPGVTLDEGFAWVFWEQAGTQEQTGSWAARFSFVEQNWSSPENLKVPGDGTGVSIVALGSEGLLATKWLPESDTDNGGSTLWMSFNSMGEPGQWSSWERSDWTMPSADFVATLSSHETGGVIAVGEDESGRLVWSKLSRNSRSWTAPAVITRSGQGPISDIDVVVDAHGRALIVWREPHEGFQAFFGAAFQ